jgi:hypothetical protein
MYFLLIVSIKVHSSLYILLIVSIEAIRPSIGGANCFQNDLVSL